MEDMGTNLSEIGHWEESLPGAGRWLTTNGGRKAQWSATFCLRALYISSVSTTTNLLT